MFKFLKKAALGIILLAIVVSFLPQPAQAVGLPFGGKIVYSRARICNVPPFSPFFVPVPVQEIGVLQKGVYRTYVYIYYTFILQIFGVTSTLYNYANVGNFLRTGPSILGQYIPAPVTTGFWDCFDLSPTINIITKMGTSL